MDHIQYNVALLPSTVKSFVLTRCYRQPKTGGKKLRNRGGVQPSLQRTKFWIGFVSHWGGSSVRTQHHFLKKDEIKF